MSVWDQVADLLDPPRTDPWGELGATLYPKQQLAEELCETTDETLFGGAVGGGKSYWLLLHAIAHCLRYRGAKVLVLRRDWPRLRRSIWADSFVWLTGLATVDKSSHVWTFANGSTIEFSGLDRDEDVHKYQGAAYSLICWEELTEFTEYQYTYMLSRNRPPMGADPDIRCHVAATTNPGGVGHSWVKARWVRPPETLDSGERNVPEGVDVRPFEAWLPCPNEDQEVPLSRVFVPATLEDNFHLSEADPGYASRAAAGSSAGMRKALTSGDWDAIDAIEGALFSMTQIDADRVFRDDDGVWLPEGCQLVRTVTMVDPAATHGENSDDTGIVTAARVQHPPVEGRKPQDHGYVLADDTCHLPPEGWARTAVLAAHRERADAIGVEIDNGGETNLAVLNQAQRQLLQDGEIGKQLPIFPVRSRGKSKAARARPVSQLYAHHRVHHVGHLARLEDQLATWIPELTPDSPDRLDAMVHAVLSLPLTPAAAPAPAKPEPVSEEELIRRRHRAVASVRTPGAGLPL